MAPVLDLIKPCVLPGVPGLVPVLMAVRVVVLWLALALAVCKPRTSVLWRLPLQIVMVVNFPGSDFGTGSDSQVQNLGWIPSGLR